MAYATGSQVRTAYVPEATYGQVPATPAFKIARFTGGPGLRTNKTTASSAEIRADRNIPDEFQLGQDISGSYPFELSYGSHDDLFEAALAGAWNNNVLANASAFHSFVFEQTYLSAGATLAEHRFAGVLVDGFTLSATARAAITGAFTMMGQAELDDTADVTGATYAAAATTPVLTASAHVGALSVLGLNPQPKIRKIDLAVTNHLYGRPVVGSLYSDQPGSGQCDVTGSLEAYFSSNALYAQALAHGRGTITFTVGVGAGSRYTFALPNVQLGNMDVPLVANNNDLIVTIPFRAIYDATSGASMSITRAV